MRLRELRKNEIELLPVFLYEAIFIQEGKNPPDREIIELPELKIYYEDFGTGKADYCIVADDDGKIIGAVWTRIMNDYGHVDDDIIKIMHEFDDVDVIVSVSPSYWADIPGQYKAFIDRCTPWCDTHEPHASIREGKKGYTIALRTGPGMHECDRIIQSIEHFYGHLHIECSGHLGLVSIENKENVGLRKQEIIAFCKNI